MDAERLPLVLMYHSVEPYVTDPYRVTVHPRRFDQQLRWLRRARAARGRHGRAAERRAEPGTGRADLRRRVRRLRSRPCCPPLARYGFTATVFVIAEALGGHNALGRAGTRARR